MSDDRLQSEEVSIAVSGWDYGKLPSYTITEVDFTEEEYQRALTFKRRIQALRKREAKLEAEYSMRERISDEWGPPGIILTEDGQDHLILKRHMNKSYTYTNRFKRVPQKIILTYDS